MSKKQVNISCKLVLAKNTLFAIELVYALFVMIFFENRYQFNPANSAVGDHGSQEQCYKGVPVYIFYLTFDNSTYCMYSHFLSRKCTRIKWKH